MNLGKMQAFISGQLYSENNSCMEDVARGHGDTYVVGGRKASVRVQDDAGRTGGMQFCDKKKLPSGSKRMMHRSKGIPASAR